MTTSLDRLTCATVAAALPGILDGRAPGDPTLVAHVETCLVCQAELARYRRLLRLLAQLRSERVALPDGLIAEILGAVEARAERQAIRSALAQRRVRATLGFCLGALAASGIVVLARARMGTRRHARRPEGAS